MIKTLTLTLGSFITFLVPIKGLFILILLAVLIDTITGIRKTYKLLGKQAIRSGKMFNIAPKLAMYLSTTLLMHCIDVFIFNGTIYGITSLLAKSIAMVWVYIELKSIDENRQEMGHKSMIRIVKELLSGIKTFKKDLNEIK